MTYPAILLSKVCVVLLIAAGALVQALILPLQATQTVELFPEVSFLLAPILILCILFVLCGQVVLGCAWVLLSLVGEGTIFTSRAFKYVDIMIGSLVAAPIIAIVAFVIVSAASAASPGVFLLTVGAVLGCITLAFVLVVMRGLLVKASDQARYLAEVV